MRISDWSSDVCSSDLGFEIGVELGDLDLKAPEALARLKRSFEARHEELYAYHLPEQQPVLVNARVATVGVLPELPSEPAVAAQRPSSVKGRRKIYLGERSEEHTSELQSLMRISYAVFCLKKKN